MTIQRLLLGLSLCLAAGAARAQTSTVYSKAPAGDKCRALGAILLRPLVDSTALGGSEVELAELTLPVGYDTVGQGHAHGKIEILYVLSGRLGHVVNGVSHELGPGGVGIVRPGDRVRHHVLSTVPVRVVAVWAPGGELNRLLGPSRDAACPPR